MKKNILKINLLIIIFSFCLIFSGCNKYENILMENFSDLRINYYEGKCQNYFCNISCGYREKDFYYDGKSTDKVECGVITLGFFDICSYAKIIIELFVDDQTTEVVLEHSPYEELFMADIGYIINSNNVFA